jgi:outer membrane protein assembly factor BamB
MYKLSWLDQSSRCLAILVAICASLSNALVRLEGVDLRLPVPVTSFGACVEGNALYVYGGHRGEAHVYSQETHALHFVRVRVDEMDEWESLPFNRPLQGFGMAAHRGKIYVAGGSQATNPEGGRSNLSSVSEVSVFDPKKKIWGKITPLPEPRSSHELLAHKGNLYVIGGWNMQDGKGVDWHRHGLVADLSENPVKWRRLPETLWRIRANSAAVVKNSLFVIGGLDENGTTDAVRKLDLKSLKWTEEAPLPGVNRLKGFGSASCNLDGRLIACGFSYQPRLFVDSNSSWADTKTKVVGKRFFHRMVPLDGKKVAFIGGADFDGHMDSLEVLDFSASLSKEAKDEVPKGAVWRGFRGDGNSHSQARGLPVQWSDEKNLRWRKKLPGYGQSTPVVWRDRVFSTSTQGDFSEKLLVHCHNLATGELLWRKSYPAPVKIKRSGYVSQAAPSPVVDGRAVYLFFESGQLLALDHQGKELWKRSLTEEYGPMQGNHGIGSSLFQSEDALGLLVDHAGPSYLLRINKKTGKSIWKKNRPERVSWSTPTLSDSGEQETVFISSNGIVESYDFLDGKRLWQREGVEGNTVAAPSFTDDLTIIGSSTPGQSMALSRKGRTNEGGKLLWVAEDGSCSFGSPLVTAKYLYLVNRAGVVTCHDLKDGRKKWNLRLPASCWASPMKTEGRIYFFTKDGVTVVLKDDGSKEILAENKLSIEGRVYGVASIHQTFVIRTGSELICVSNDGSPEE